ncbi:hypothetical protein [Halorarum salinum]|uniref:Uncharacterized protein n=1 Tax=Halorarum salinum TaxID=2743089 RepID=A0A7D5L861_9EURY|nr:hypothetical protein [Halobaculum salinum]QLG60271.1 hypothetical protein HUG12_00210 [Halobaculum salinum]
MILQLSFFMDFLPAVGLGLILLGAFLSIEAAFVDSQTAISGLEGYLVTLLLGAGLVIGVYQIHLSEPFLLVVVFGMAGKYIQGIAAVRLYQKLSFAARTRSLSWGGVSLQTKVISKLGVVFIILFGGTVVSLLTMIGILELPLSTVLIGTWTVAVVLYTILGLSITLYGATEEFPPSFSIGLILLVAGAEVYNLASLELELIAAAVLSLSYSYGFWLAAYRFVTEDPSFDQLNRTSLE